MQLQAQTVLHPLPCGSSQHQKLKRLRLRSARACRSVPRIFAATAQDLRTLHLTAREATPEAFAPFGQLIGPTKDGKGFDEQDASLKLDLGTPRFYIMRLPKRGMNFDRITYHADVTQCLGGLTSASWYLAVAAPSGSVEKFPKEADLQAFQIPAGNFVKLHQGAWHAGPLFQDADFMDFYNLELSDTNQVDHNTHVYSKQDGVQYKVVP